MGKKEKKLKPEEVLAAGGLIGGFIGSFVRKAFDLAQRDYARAHILALANMLESAGHVGILSESERETIAKARTFAESLRGQEPGRGQH